jgi:hypothetical protein
MFFCSTQQMATLSKKTFSDRKKALTEARALWVFASY